MDHDPHAVSLSAARLPKLDAETTEHLLQLGPAGRGFWKDDELLAWTGLSSVHMLRKLQANRLLVADHIARPSGGLLRVWVFREVVLAAAIQDFSKRTGIATLPAAELFKRLTRAWVLDAVGFDPEVLTMEKDRPIRPAARLAIIDMREAWAEVASNTYELVSQGMTIGSGPLHIPPSANPVRLRKETLEARGAVRMWADFSQMASSTLDRIREPSAVPHV